MNVCFLENARALLKHQCIKMCVSTRIDECEDGNGVDDIDVRTVVEQQPRNTLKRKIWSIHKTCLSSNAMDSSRIMLCNGWFKTVPSMFYQLYTIHGIPLS